MSSDETDLTLLAKELQAYADEEHEGLTQLAAQLHELGDQRADFSAERVWRAVTERVQAFQSSHRADGGDDAWWPCDDDRN